MYIFSMGSATEAVDARFLIHVKHREPRANIYILSRYHLVSSMLPLKCLYTSLFGICFVWWATCVVFT